MGVWGLQIRRRTLDSRLARHRQRPPETQLWGQQGKKLDTGALGWSVKAPGGHKKVSLDTEDVVPGLAPGSRLLCPQDPHTFLGGFLYFLLQMKQDGDKMVGIGGRKGRDRTYLHGSWSEFEVRSWGIGQGGGALAEP